MQESADYSKVITRKYPEQVVIAIAKDGDGKFNPITLGWTMITSGKPPMMAISVGLTRHSLGVIRKAKEFVISMPSVSMTRETLFYGSKSGRNMDKIAECLAKTELARKIDCVLFSNAVANFECFLVDELPTGDHVLFVGEVIASHMNTDASVKRLYTVGVDHRMGKITVS